MKFGQHIKQSMVAEWEEHYMRYGLLKEVIKSLEASHLGSPQHRSYLLSMSIPPTTNAAAQPQSGSTIAEDLVATTQEEFFLILEEDMEKVQAFVDLQMVALRDLLGEARLAVRNVQSGSESKEQDRHSARAKLDSLGDQVLRLEKYVNLNFTGFQKILKKHDKRLPSPCRAFYLQRLHAMPWLNTGIGDIMAALAELYAELRGDRASIDAG